MEKEVKTLQEQIELVAKNFLEKSKDKEIQIVSHFDTDGITSAAIMIKTLQKLDKNFSVKIVKNLEKNHVFNLSKDKLTIFLDLASNAFHYIQEAELQDVFIIDHHEIIQNVPENIHIINSELHNKEKTSASCLTYLFCKEFIPDSKELAKLAILGLIGDFAEKNLEKINNQIMEDSEIKKKRGLMIYPSTRPLNRVLKFNSNPYIPGVTGDIKGVSNLLRETNLNSKNGKYKSIIELNEKEMSALITAILLRLPRTTNSDDIIGDIFLVKLFNKLEDARELSAKINACSRMGDSGTAIRLCLEDMKIKKKAETLHVKYKQLIISALEFISKTKKIQGKGYLIINAKKQIPDTIIGTVASIMSNSAMYEEGTTIVTMATNRNKIKVSSRIVGTNGRNIREVLAKVVSQIGGEVGGHKHAAGCNIAIEKEQEFINSVKKELEIEMVKI